MLFKHVDLKNKNSQVTLFDTDAQNKVFTGSSSAASDEAKALIGGSSLKTNEVINLFKAVVSGQESNGTAGVEGVELVGLTDTGFTLRIEGNGATIDTIIVTGSAAIQAINDADAERTTDLKDGNTAFDVFDVSSETSEFIGGTSGEINDIVGG
ncbi:MAG: hypothetical protein AAGG48_01405 [Planctomycetota bacterium]